jgi:hypothetical protein
MSKKVKPTATASKIRRGANRRKNKQKGGRKGGGEPTPSAPSVIANSIFALTLPALKGHQIEERNGTSGSSILEGLRSVYKRLTPGKPPAPSFGLSVVSEAKILVGRIIEALPKSLKIDKEAVDFKSDEKGFFLQLFHQCDFPEFMPSFEIGSLMMRLKKGNLPLYRLFAQFLHTFFKTCHIPTWYNGIYANCLDRLTELTDREEMEPEFVERIKALEEEYEHGAPHQAMRDILSTKMLSAQELLRKANRFHPNIAVIKVIKRGCDLIAEGLGMFDFSSDEYSTQNFSDYYLCFEHQVLVLWKYGGIISEEFDEWINDEAQNGVAPPVAQLKIRASNRSPLDQNSFVKLCGWPQRLADFFKYFNKTIS